MRAFNLFLLWSAFLAGGLIPAAEPREPTRVALREGPWFINGRVTNPGSAARAC